MSRQERTDRELRRVLPTVAVVLLCVVALAAAFSRRAVPTGVLEAQNGVLDVRQADLEHQVYEVTGRWDFYPGALYSSRDFAAGAAGEKAGPEASPADWAYGTHRLVIRAQPGRYYALGGFSMDYATRVFVNGAEAAAYGQVAETAEASVPRVGYMTIPLFSGDDGEIEVILQYSNYVHRDGGHVPLLYLSTPQNIEEFKAVDDLVSLTLSGGLLLLAAYFLLCAAARRKAVFLCLVLCCVLMALRDQNFLVLHLLAPDASWYFAYRTLILVVMLLPVSILLLLKCQYWQATSHRPLYAYLALAAAAGVLICLLPTRQLVSVSTGMYYLSIPYLLYLLFGVVRFHRRQGGFTVADVLVLAGFALLLAGLLYEALLTGRSVAVTRYGTAVYGMLGFVLLSGAAFNLRAQQREVELMVSRSRGEMLEKMNQLNLDFLHKVAHELKTPLTVISGYAQLTGMQLAADKLSEETPANLKTIQQEAQRLANMVTRLMEYSYGRKSETRFERVGAEQLLEGVRAIASPMCVKNNNEVTAAAAPGCPDVHGNFEMLLQIFLNLILNANKCTQNGTIRISAEAGPAGFVLFRAEDTGSGIPPEALPHIFEQGYSASGGSGLGLTICKEAVEAHGGEIRVERTGPEGTVFAFTIPREASER